MSAAEIFCTDGSRVLTNASSTASSRALGSREASSTLLTNSASFAGEPIIWSAIAKSAQVG